MTPAPPSPADDAGSRIALLFILAEIACQLALLVPELNDGPLRAFWRIGSFGASAALVFLLRGKNRAFAASIAAVWVMGIVILSIFNPTTNSWFSAIAQTGLYLAVLGPLFWVSRLRISLRGFQRVMRALWAYYSASALVGILQVYYPGRFQPAVSPLVLANRDALDGLKIVLASGHKIFRPMGLTDTPGGASSAGMWALLFGLGFLVTSRSRLQQALALAGMTIGMMCIYLSQIRVIVVVVAIWLIALLLLLLWQRRWRQLAAMAALAVLLALGSFALALSVGGKDMARRMATLSAPASSSQVYATERGGFVAQTFHVYLPEYPLGAGLGRWGMMNYYFGNNDDPDRGNIYVEIQWTGWILDGGIPLTLAYLAAIALAMFGLARIARRRGPLWFWATLCLAYDFGTLALTFDYTPFIGQAGLEFWFFNALVLTAAACVPAAAPLRRATYPAYS